jgi:hypothetical protein
MADDILLISLFFVICFLVKTAGMLQQLLIFL